MRKANDRPSQNAMGGYLYPLDYRGATARRASGEKTEGEKGGKGEGEKKPKLKAADIRQMLLEWHEATGFPSVWAFAELLSGCKGCFADNRNRLCVKMTMALRELGTVYTGKAWAFPMRNARGAPIGIRLRKSTGEKWAVTGSRQGLFYQHLTASPQPLLFILEGPTDTAAALAIGLHALGRPSCQGQEKMIAQFIRLRPEIEAAVIVADNDGPGQAGAKKLLPYLPVRSVIWTPSGVKDFREWVKAGGTREALEDSLKSQVSSLKK